MKNGGKESTALAVSLANRLGGGGVGSVSGSCRGQVKRNFFPLQISITELCVRPLTDTTCRRASICVCWGGGGGVGGYWPTRITKKTRFQNKSLEDEMAYRDPF
jgi:hypothetical protein